MGKGVSRSKVVKESVCMSLFGGGGGDQSRQIFSSPLLKKSTDVHHHLSTTTFCSTWTTFTWVRQQTVFCKKNQDLYFICLAGTLNLAVAAAAFVCCLPPAADVYRSFCLPIILLMIWLLRWCGSILSLSHFYLKYVNCSRSKRQLNLFEWTFALPLRCALPFIFILLFFLQKDLLFLSFPLLCVWLTSLFFATKKKFLFFWW